MQVCAFVCERVHAWGRVSLDTVMGSQTACSGPLEINGIPAPNSYYQAASDPYLLCGKCSQSHFILAHTHTNTHAMHTLCACGMNALRHGCQSVYVKIFSPTQTNLPGIRCMRVC